MTHRRRTTHRPVRARLSQELSQELSLRLARDRYQALARLRVEQGGADWFPVRMLGRPALVMRGDQGARTFYDAELVTRRGAVPAPIRLLLFGPGAVHGLNGAVHSRRKSLFLDVLDPDATTALAATVGRELEQRSAEWAERGGVRLFDELVGVYGQAALTWAGAGESAAESELLAVSHDLALIVDGFGIGGTPYVRAAAARVRAQRWARRVIRDVRDGRTSPPAGSPVAVLASTSRSLLPDLVAGTELLNIVRPTVAVAYFGAYAAQALCVRPDWRDELAAGSAEHLRAFEHEVRRWYPFAPLLTARLKRPCEWQDRTFGTRDWMVLDVLGTNRDPRLWERPDEFRPERFLDREPTPYDYVPHGGGDPARGHRCPGEPLARSVLSATIQHLAGLDYELDEAARQVPLDRIPSLPADGVTLRGTRSRTGQAASR
jgi:fatty-acid peroxygenase